MGIFGLLEKCLYHILRGLCFRFIVLNCWSKNKGYQPIMRHSSHLIFDPINTATVQFFFHLFIFLLTLPSYVQNDGLGNHNSYCQLLWPQLYRNKLHSTVITHNEQCYNGHAKVITKSLETTCYWQARQTTGGIAFDAHTFPCAGILNVVGFL